MPIEFVSQEEHDELRKAYANLQAQLAFACHLGSLFIEKSDGAIALTEEEVDTDTSDWKLAVTHVNDTGHSVYSIDKGDEDGDA